MLSQRNGREYKNTKHGNIIPRAGDIDAPTAGRAMWKCEKKPLRRS